LPLLCLVKFLVFPALGKSLINLPFVFVFGL
jgi:hypothetical protein